MALNFSNFVKDKTLYFIYLIWVRFCYVDLKLLGSNNPPASAS
jgi:hypothetical protein